MHKDLQKVFDSVVECVIRDQRCKGGWQYGSVGRGASDIYSDIDPVFLFADEDFETFARNVPNLMASACDELLICWAENYNDRYFKNFCSVVRMGENLHQHDFFMLNIDHTGQWMCRQHLKGCTRANIIFDRTGEVGALLDKGLRTDNTIPDTFRAIDTYWFHITMLIKYFKRRDMFKLLKNMDMVFHAHVDVLLSQYDTLDWGAWESKVKHCIPLGKQQHLKEYFTRADFGDIEGAVKKCMPMFRQDGVEACAYRGLAHPDAVADTAMAYFHRRMGADAEDWRE